MKKHIVVIGASGTLGTYLTDELLEQDYNIFACGRRNIVKNYYTKNGIGSAIVDITKKEDFKKLPQSNVKAVILLAGAMPSRMIGYNPQLYIDVNITGTLNVLEYCKNVNAEKIIFTHSHSDVAGYWNTGEYIKADAPRKTNFKGDHGIYVISKNTAVDMTEHYFLDYGIKNIILRLPTIYSYRPLLDMYVNGEKQIMAHRYLLERAIKGDTLEVWGNPKISKDIVYVKDFTQMVIKSIKSDNARGLYNVATGVPTSLEQQIQGLVDVFSPKDKPSKLIYKPEKKSQISYLYDISNAEKDLGYKPQYDYISMLKDMKKEMHGIRFKHLENTDFTIK